MRVEGNDIQELQESVRQQVRGSATVLTDVGSLAHLPTCRDSLFISLSVSPLPLISCGHTQTHDL